MSNWVIGLVVKPFVALVFFAIVYALVALVGWALPPSRVKTFLFKRRG